MLKENAVSEKAESTKQKVESSLDLVFESLHQFGEGMMSLWEIWRVQVFRVALCRWGIEP
jgi:hypothetical protein